jgi:hypothetical protein
MAKPTGALARLLLTNGVKQTNKSKLNSVLREETRHGKE